MVEKTLRRRRSVQVEAALAEQPAVAPDGRPALEHDDLAPDDTADAVEPAAPECLDDVPDVSTSATAGPAPYAPGPPGPIVRPGIEAVATPLLKQYLAIKEKHRDDVLFFRMGDFYELFFEDAELVSRVLGIALTARGTGPDAYAFAGFPIHAIDRYLPRLIAAGYRVAICEQTEDPALARGKRIVERAVVEVITPGTLTDEKLLEARAANFLLAVHVPRARARTVGMAWFEASSGRFLVAEVARERVEEELVRIGPAEVVVSEQARRAAEDEPTSPDAQLLAAIARRAPVSTVPDWVLRPQGALEALKQRFGVATLGGLGLDDRAAYVSAAHAALHYVGEKKPGFLDRLDRFGRGVELYRPDDHLCLDPATARCLEITSGLRENTGRAATLLGAIDRTHTAMGSRLLREWLLSPLRRVEAIEARHDAVGALLSAPRALEDLQRSLAQVYDLERLAGRVASGRMTARDLAALRDSLGHLPKVRAAALEVGASGPVALVERAAARLDPLEGLRERLARALLERPAPSPKDGEVIAPGWSEELDQLRSEAGDVTATLARFQQREAERTGIASLKVGYNKVFGYYIEVTQAHRKKVPDDYVRKQSLKHAERFLTPELKELEGQMLSARDRAEALEAQLLSTLRDEVSAAAPGLLASSAAAAELDVLGSLAQLARERGYVRPRVSDDAELRVVAGRHPVLDLREGRERFVPNDVRLGGVDGWVHVITGPNMAGKSTYIRQAALIVLLAQTGSFVPAESAEVGVVDRIFARVGAGDELAQGLSTFMVEMTETANILRHASERSLVVLDEVGRGTSTYDGVSLAWAIAEFLHDNVRARTLFATHYHELTGLAASASGVRNMNVAVEERGSEIFFLHRIVPGSADRSYGIHVARLAGVPAAVLARAQVILRGLEAGTFDPTGRLTPEEVPEAQLALFQPVEDPVRTRLAKVDVQRTTPLEALMILEELTRHLDDGSGA
jgi:DNA mismatch repair protein MutS